MSAFMFREEHQNHEGAFLSLGVSYVPWQWVGSRDGVAIKLRIQEGEAPRGSTGFAKCHKPLEVIICKPGAFMKLYSIKVYRLNIGVSYSRGKKGGANDAGSPDFNNVLLTGVIFREWVQPRINSAELSLMAILHRIVSPPQSILHFLVLPLVTELLLCFAENSSDSEWHQSPSTLLSPNG